MLISSSNLFVFVIYTALEELKGIISRAEGLSREDLSKLDAAVDTLAVLTRELEAKGASVNRLRRLIFGPSTEKASRITGKPKEGRAASSSDSGEKDSGRKEDSGDTQAPPKKKKRQGHGRNGSKKYTGARRVKTDHERLRSGDRCPECLKGKVYRQKEPAVLVRVTGVAPLAATVYEQERLRCNLCGEVFTAKAPEGVGQEKYDAKAAVMIGLLKYGCGMPFNRLERLEGSLGIPLPASTQWEVVEPLAVILFPVYTELIHQAAQGKVLYNDDTVARILNLEESKNELLFNDNDGKINPKRKGVFTSGIVSAGTRQIALFFTGRKHAGENLADVLKHRAAELKTPVHMSDGLAVNTAGEMETIEVECNSHARRRFIDVADSYPDEVGYVLEIFKAVYANDDKAKKEQMTDKERLAYHQQHSGPLMTELENWFEEQFQQRDVEPNSTLGAAITYMQKHWFKLTQFLRTEGAPLDNNICERALKRAILHRKNALFFKTQNGAKVADIFMSLIYTAELCHANPFDYLVSLHKFKCEVAKSPENWLPWNYKAAIEALHR